MNQQKEWNAGTHIWSQIQQFVWWYIASKASPHNMSPFQSNSYNITIPDSSLKEIHAGEFITFIHLLLDMSISYLSHYVILLFTL